jgi:hypothetical protein
VTVHEFTHITRLGVHKYSTKTITGAVNLLLFPIRKQSMELVVMEVQILRLLCGLLWLMATISVSLSSIGFESKILLLSFGSLTIIDILLRSFKLAEVRKVAVKHHLEEQNNSH